MLDEDEVITLLEALAARHREAVAMLPGGAVLIRPKPDRIVIVGGLDVAACAAAQAAGRTPEAAAWWLGLTDWGRLDMWGDLVAADGWVQQQTRER